MLNNIHGGSSRSQAGGRTAEVLDVGLVSWRAADALFGWVCPSAPRAGAVFVTAKAGADLELSLPRTKMSVNICGVSAVCSGRRRVGI